MSYKSVRPFLRNVSLLNGRIFKVSATINMQERFQFMMGGILFLIVVIVPVGAVMFVISGIWSALDRALLRLNR